MLKKIFELIKKIVFSVFIIYGFNLITVGLITILGMPALFSLILIYFIVF